MVFAKRGDTIKSFRAPGQVAWRPGLPELLVILPVLHGEGARPHGGTGGKGFGLAPVPSLFHLQPLGKIRQHCQAGTGERSIKEGHPADVYILVAEHCASFKKREGGGGLSAQSPMQPEYHIKQVSWVRGRWLC